MTRHRDPHFIREDIIQNGIFKTEVDHRDISWSNTAINWEENSNPNCFSVVDGIHSKKENKTISDRTILFIVDGKLSHDVHHHKKMKLTLNVSETHPWFERSSFGATKRGFCQRKRAFCHQLLLQLRHLCRGPLYNRDQNKAPRNSGSPCIQNS